jgi:hypothetical protein
LGKIVNYVDSSTLAGAAKPKKNERSCPGNSYLHKNQNVSRGCMSRHRTSGLFFVPAAFARSDFYKGSEGVSTKTRYPGMAISRTASTMMENSMRNAFQLGSIARTKRSSNLYHMKRYSFGRGQRCFFSSQACAEHLPPRPGRRSAGSHKTGTTRAASLLTSCRILGTRRLRKLKIRGNIRELCGCPSWTLIEPCASPRGPNLEKSWNRFGRCCWPHTSGVRFGPANSRQTLRQHFRVAPIADSQAQRCARPSFCRRRPQGSGPSSVDPDPPDYCLGA